MKKIKELAILFSIIMLTIIKENWKQTIKLLIVSLLIWAMCVTIPHNIPFIKDLSYISWISIILIFKLLTIKYNEDNNDQHQEDDDIDTEIEDDEGKVQNEPTSNGSTRE